MDKADKFTIFFLFYFEREREREREHEQAGEDGERGRESPK